MKKDNIALIGFMGCGKTTIAEALERKLGMKTVDVDAEIVKRKGMEITDIFDAYGEEYFRDYETRTLKAILHEKGQIISCGGGAVMRSENVKALKHYATVVLLTATPKTTLERVKDSENRPILNGNMNTQYIEALMKQRKKHYEAAADLMIATDNKSVDEICDELIRKTFGL